MSKFKVGDRVRVTSSTCQDWFPNGTTGVVSRPGGFYDIEVVKDGGHRDFDDDCGAFNDDELELVEDEPQPYDMPSPDADALDRIADAVRDVLEPNDGDGFIVKDYISSSVLVDVLFILRETGRLW